MVFNYSPSITFFHSTIVEHFPLFHQTLKKLGELEEVRFGLSSFEVNCLDFFAFYNGGVLFGRTPCLYGVQFCLISMLCLLLVVYTCIMLSLAWICLHMLLGVRMNTYLSNVMNFCLNFECLIELRPLLYWVQVIDVSWLNGDVFAWCLIGYDLAMSWPTLVHPWKSSSDGLFRPWLISNCGVRKIGLKGLLAKLDGPF